MDATQLKTRWHGGQLCVTVMVCLIATSGCCLHKKKRSWCPPNLATPMSERELSDNRQR